MSSLSTPQGSSFDAVQQVLDETRRRFIASFAAQCDTLRRLVDEMAALGQGGPVAALTQATHRLSGLAGTIGFPAIGVRASELEDLVNRAGRDGFDATLARTVVEEIRGAFTPDLARLSGEGPVTADPPPAIFTANGARILLAEDEADQRAIVSACLERAGYRPIAVVSGDLVLETARAEKPALILLDIAMPRLDGYSACRLLKADAELAAIPVIFMTTGANLDDKLAGLALGADEFLVKPVDMRELVLRIQLVLERSRFRGPLPATHEPPVSNALTYEAFLAVASAEMAKSPAAAAALAIVRLPAERHSEGSRLLTEEIRGRDTIVAYGPAHVLILMPEMTAAHARDRLEPMVDRLIARGLNESCGGVTAAPGIPAGAPGAKTAEVLVAEAAEALAEAHYLGDKSAIWSERAGPRRPAAVPRARTVVVAEDDPDVTRIVDAQLRAAGYTTIIAFDGEQALAAVRAGGADALVLDLMMPRLDGFDVLTQIRGDSAPRPRTIVLSARGREQDVMRAFELGADDYMTKPFSPQELMARIVRLLK